MCDKYQQHEAWLAAIVEDTVVFCMPDGCARGEVPRVDGNSLSPIKFLREHVARNTPCIITNLLENNPDWEVALGWNLQNLLERVPDPKQEFSVNCTPDGLGDFVLTHPAHGKIFVKPHEAKMTFQSFVDDLLERRSNRVAYLSAQNDNLRQEFDFLAKHVPNCLAIAKETLGRVEATNLWIGDDRAISSLHQDYFQNLYCVLEGEKDFTLVPPSINPKLFMSEGTFLQSHFIQDESSNEEWSIQVENDQPQVQWIPLDPLQDLARNNTFGSTVLSCKVRAGEVLYLPAMWLHRVTQTQPTIAVNYWHEWDQNNMWVYNTALSTLPEI